jgi:lysozyme
MTPQARATALVAVALLPVTGGLVASWEGTEFTPYRDLGGVWTVCEGVTGPAVIPGKVYSRQECRDLLNGELRTHALGLAKCLTTVPPQPVLTAWISWTYNVGVANACGSTLVRLANAGQFEAACRQLPRWNQVNGKPVQGLTNRRHAEMNWCLYGLGLVPMPRSLGVVA